MVTNRTQVSKQMDKQAEMNWFTRRVVRCDVDKAKCTSAS